MEPTNTQAAVSVSCKMSLERRADSIQDEPEGEDWACWGLIISMKDEKLESGGDAGVCGSQRRSPVSGEQREELYSWVERVLCAARVYEAFVRRR